MSWPRSNGREGLNGLDNGRKQEGCFPLRDCIVCEGDVRMKKMHWMMAALPVVGALTFAAHAEAGVYHLTFGGDGNVSGSITLTTASDPKAGAAFGTPLNLVPSGPGYVGIADPLSASLITAVTGSLLRCGSRNHE